MGRVTLETIMQQRTAEWHEARIGKVTGSQVGAILGLDPYRTPDDVLRAMVRAAHGAEPEFTGNVATEYGTFHEDGARAEYEIVTGRTVEQCAFYTAEGQWLGASPDGLVQPNGLVEIKCPYSLRDKAEPLFKTAAEQMHYFAQMQIQMYCTDRNWTDFWQWAPHGHKLERVERNDDWLDATLPKLKAFYDHYLEALKKPDDHLAPKRQQIQTIEAAKLLAEYDELQESIDLAKERLDDIKARFAEMSNGQDAEILGRKWTKVKRAGSVSYAKVVKDHLPKINLEPYRGKPTEFWKLS